MTIYMMRHGKTEANVKKYYAGKDESILPIDQKRIHDIANTVRDLNIRWIVASPYLRTRETAKCIGNELHLPVTINREIYEINLGVLENKTFEEAFAIYGDALQPWIDDPFTNGPPQGESLEEVYDRAANFLSTARDDTLYVSHDGFIRAVRCVSSGDIRHFFDYKIENLEIVTI